MRMFRKKAKDIQISRAEALNSTPVKSNKIEESRLESGVVRLTYPMKTRPWVGDLMRRFGRDEPQVQFKKVELDELGTAVWDLIDGSRSVRQIVREFGAAYQLQAKEAEVAVTSFLRDLGKRGLIGLK